MTYNTVIEAKRKPKLNPDARVLGQNSPKVKAEVDKAIGALISTGNSDFSKEDILNALNSWGKPYLDDLELELDKTQTVDSEENDNIGDQNNALSPEKQDALERMKRMMDNMELKQVKLLKSLLVKGNDNENN
jgi:hypothetical protein